MTAPTLKSKYYRACNQGCYFARMSSNQIWMREQTQDLVDGDKEKEKWNINKTFKK